MTPADTVAEGIVLLTTKLHPPRRRRTLVARPRLRGLATRSGHPALTLVSAPAGFGKTTLVADWFAREATTAWLSLDARDDDPEQFWTYVLAALATVTPDLSEDTAALLQGHQAPLETVVATLINDLETASQDIVLVLDDYHVINAPEIHDSVAFLLAHLPPQVSLVITTRADPPLPLASLRANGDLLEVRAADLRFTAEEAAEYLNGAMELTLSQDDVDVLEARTEGWIAALQLAALSMQGRSDPASFINEFAGDDRFILDYLADEVLERQTPRIRDFLLDTSILSRLTGPLCAAVTGQDDAKAILDELDRSNLFLVPLDDRRTWYRYHHLFGDVVRAKLLDERSDRVVELHCRASDWYAGIGEPREAILHALAAEDHPRAAKLIELTAPAMQRARQELQLRNWLEALPADLFDDRPVLAMALVGARMAAGDADGLDPLLEIVDSWLVRTDPPIVYDEVAYARLPAMAAVHRAGLALLSGDTDRAIEHAQRVRDLVGADDHLQRGAAAALLGLAHWNLGDLDNARDRYIESIARFELGAYLPDVMGCSLALADIQLTQGRLHDAQRTFESALRHAADHPGLRGAADMHVGLSLLAVERNDLETAADHLRASAELGEHTGLPQHPYRWRVAAARLHEAEGDLDQALDLLNEAESRYTTDYSPSVRPVTALEARIEVKRGDLEAGARWAEKHGLSADDELSYVREFEHITLACVLLARGSAQHIEHATGLLERLLTAADDGHRVGSSIEILLLLALARQAAGDHTDANTCLRQALARAEPEGYVRSFLDLAPPVAKLLHPLGASDRYAARILGEGTSSPQRNRPHSSDPDQLSDREIEVLRLLRTDLSGPDIARELHVSLNTLRTHTKHIYTKLGATNRREAVTRAAELGV
jgi:LuxR family maltose regulon positive regulatory protein